MDIIKFNSPTSPTKLERGEVVNGLKSKLWVERYAVAGEFKLIASAESDILTRLPVGTLISHVDTTEVMIVEDHEIDDDRSTETEIVITGRGFETFFINRIVGSNKTFPTSNGIIDYTLAANETWDQAVVMLNDHLSTASLIDDNNAIEYLTCLTDIVGAGTSVSRSIKRGDLYSELLKLLSVDDLGIKVIRPGVWSPLAPGSPNMAALIHKGADRSDSVVFSYDTGEIEKAGYLWSNRPLRNTVLVSGKWVETLVTTTKNFYERRMMYLNASDIDNSYSAAPTGSALTDIIAAMQERGKAALAAQKQVALTKAEISKDTVRAAYRQDYDVGDIVMVAGDYNAASKMRISEYVESEDENGSVGYPTLSVI